MTAAPFADNAIEHYDKGWHPFPSSTADDADTKKPVLSGSTGRTGRDHTREELEALMARYPTANIGVRMPEGVLGVDVDQRGDKTGWDNLAKFQAEHGLSDLPFSLMVTARQPPCGILMFKVPYGYVASDSAIDDVDMIQRHHRFISAPGSVHIKTGDEYKTIDPTTGEMVDFPYVAQLKPLPIDWLEAIAHNVTPTEVREAIDWTNPNANAAQWSEATARAFAYWTDNKAGGAHTALMKALGALVRLDSLKGIGTGTALERLKADFVGLVTARTDDSRRTTAQAEAEFQAGYLAAVHEISTTESTAEQSNPASADIASEAAKFFSRDGLHATDLGNHVLDQGPIRPGRDGRLWAWIDGYWQPTGAEETRRRVRSALDQRFRPSHNTTIVEWLKAEPDLDPNQPDFATINCASGLLDWRTGELRDHTPEHSSTTRLPVRWNPNAECPAIDEFLGRVLADDAKEFFYEVVGYMCAAGNPLHVALLLLGSGRNGKGATLRLLEALLGVGNCANVTPHQLADNRFAAAGLYGKLANIAGDLEARLIERTDLFKMATGGDSISAEFKYGAAFTFRCWATFAFSANEAPAVRDHSEGYYARWLVVPFPNTIEAGERLPEHVLDARLHHPNELEGFFAKAVQGLRRLMDRGRFEPPGSVVAATEQFRADTDPIAQFVAEELQADPDGWLPRKTGYDAYRQWCADSGRGAVASSKFYTRLGAFPGADLRTRRGVRGFVGITLGAVGVQQGATASTPSRVHGGKGYRPAPLAPLDQIEAF